MLESILQQTPFSPILKIDKSKFIEIDLSKTNPLLFSVDLGNSNTFESFINQYLKDNNALVAFGGYSEHRNIYQRSKIFNDNSFEERLIHLGIDLWAKAGTSIYAPLEGRIHSYANNKGVGNYGPTIILQHKIASFVFYTLYGHLALESISNISVGEKINIGQKIAEIGNYPENGDYPPHLHFQIIKDLKGMKGDYPGVTSETKRMKDLENCPNPNLMLGL